MYRMIEESRIQEVAVQLGNAAHATQVILFGSYARGEAADRSNVDLMVAAEMDLPPHRIAVPSYKHFRSYPFGMDIVVCTPQEVQVEKKSIVSFVSRVLREGKTLYERRDGIGQKVFGQSTK